MGSVWLLSEETASNRDPGNDCFAGGTTPIKNGVLNGKWRNVSEQRAGTALPYQETKPFNQTEAVGREAHGP